MDKKEIEKLLDSMDAELLKYSDEQPRDEAGRFSESTNGSGVQVHASNSSKADAHKVGMAMRREGKQVFVMTGRALQQFHGTQGLNQDKYHVFSVKPKS